MNIVGTPSTAVHLSSCTACKTFSASKLSTGTIVPSWVTVLSVPSTHPKQWKKGTGIHTLSSGPSSMHSPMWKAFLTMFVWVSCTPLGNPVVPEVYCMLMTSSASSESCLSSSSSVETSDALSRNSSKPITGDPSGGDPPIKTTFLRNGSSSLDSPPLSALESSGTAPCRIRRKSASLTPSVRNRAAASDCSRTYFSSCDLYAGFTVTSTAPTLPVANCRVTHSGTFWPQTATWSPFSIPSAISARAQPSTTSLNSRYV